MWEEEDLEWQEDNNNDGGWSTLEEDDNNSHMKMSPPILRRICSYDIVQDSNVLSIIQQCIINTSETLNIPEDDSECLLRRYIWNDHRLEKDWLELGEEQVRQLNHVKKYNPLKRKRPKTVQCQTAYCSRVSIDSSYSLSCGHVFCNDCWEGFICYKMESNGILNSVCPGYNCHKNGCIHDNETCKCNQMIPRSVVLKYLAKYEHLIKNYNKWYVDSYISQSLTIRRCINSSCLFVVEYKNQCERTIRCVCGASFCFLCGLNDHSPIPCDILKAFIALDKEEQATARLLKATTKSCPKCKILITKDRRCNHMRCTQCCYEFCWLCKGPWTKHDSSTGGYYACFIHDNKNNNELEEEEIEIMKQQKILQKYEVYKHKYDKANNAIKLICNEKNKNNVQYNVQWIKFFETMEESMRLIKNLSILSYFFQDSPEKNLFLYQFSQLSEASFDAMSRYTGKENNGSVELSIEEHIKLRNLIILLEQLCIRCKKSIEEGRFIERILYNSDLETDEWCCLVCNQNNQNNQNDNNNQNNQNDNNNNMMYCKSCRACKQHGEQECNSCKRQKKHM